MSISASYHTQTPRAATVEQLRALYRVERAATDTYGKALSSVLLRPCTGILVSCHASHEHRAGLLANRIHELGGDVPATYGIWRSLVPLFEQAAAAISAKMAVSLLEQNEERCLRDYQENAGTAQADTWAFVRDELLPRQLGTHQAMSNLKDSLS